MAGQTAAEKSDERQLAQLGLQQVFKRDLTMYSNFAITFTVMCVPGTITSKSVCSCLQNFRQKLPCLAAKAVPPVQSKTVGLRQHLSMSRYH